MAVQKAIRATLILVFLLSACRGELAQDADSRHGAKDPANALLHGIGDQNGCVVGSVPNEYAFDPFYEKYCDAGGIPIISSGSVDDLALKQASDVIMNMLAPIPDVRQELVSNGAYFGIIGKRERPTTFPEYAHMDSFYWDRRARGLGGSIASPITSTAEENLLCLTWDRYWGESIAVHEFAHTISLAGLGTHFKPLLAEFTGLYESAIQQGLSVDTYAGGDILEYWAEGVQSYFNANLEAEPPDGDHNYVNTREELADYDPALFDFIWRVFHGLEWTPTCPERE